VGYTSEPGGGQKELQALNFTEGNLGHGNRENAVELFSTSKKVPNPLVCKKLKWFGLPIKGAQEPGGQIDVAIVQVSGKALTEIGKNFGYNFYRNWEDVNNIQIK
jgi:hypothetical protein